MGCSKVKCNETPHSLLCLSVYYAGRRVCKPAVDANPNEHTTEPYLMRRTASSGVCSTLLTNAHTSCCAEGTPQSATAEKKSALNPFAKSFSFNPMAKEFTPSGGALAQL